MLQILSPIPEPELIEEDGGFMVTLFKDRFSKEELQKNVLPFIMAIT